MVISAVWRKKLLDFCIKNTTSTVTSTKVCIEQEKEGRAEHTFGAKKSVKIFISTNLSYFQF